MAKYLGNYEILAELGKGTTGAVYKARRHGSDKLVAVKVLLPKMAQNKVILQRFLREAEAASSVQHPNLVSVYGVERTEQYVFYSMEYIDGPTFDDLLQRDGPLPEADALMLMRKLAAVLAEVHKQGIAHRDIKPANIILDHLGEPKLADLGLAKLLEPEEDADSLTMDGQMIGTPHFIAPEQIDAGQIDGRTDLYGLGATFFKLLTGEYLFPLNNVTMVLLAHGTRPARSVRELRPELSERIEAIIARLLQKSPADRYPSAEALMAAIDRALRGEHPDGEVPQSEAGVKKARRRKTAKKEKAAQKAGKARRDDDDGDDEIREERAGGGATAILVVILVLLLLGGIGFLAYQLFS